jgi:hypothetical protein
MKRFNNRRDPEGIFALRTPQNPFLDIRSHLEKVQEAARAFDAETAALAAKNPPPVVRNPSPAPERPAEEIEADLRLASILPVLEKFADLQDQQASPHSRKDVASAEKIEIEDPEPAKEIPAAKPPRRRIFKKRYRKPSSRAVRAAAPRSPRRELTDLERHARKCVICQHHEREHIEQDFVAWLRPGSIARNYGIPHRNYIYRHARATGLLDVRRINTRASLELLIENADTVEPSAEAVIQAVRALACLNERGEWHNPPSHVIVSSGGRVNVPLPNGARPQGSSDSLAKPTLSIEVLSPGRDSCEISPEVLIDTPAIRNPS